MHCRLVPPPDILKPYVRYIWVLQSDGPTEAPVTFTPLADGCPGLLFQPGEKGTYVDETNKQLPEIYLYGQTIQPVKMIATGELHTIGLCFHPNAVKAVFGMNAYELTGSCVDLSLLRHKKERRLHEKLTNARSVEDQIKLISSYLVHLIQDKYNAKDAITQYAVSEIFRSKGSISLKQLQQQFQLSERSFERRFNQAIGISPKLFARICRFQQSLNQLRNNKYEKLSDIAYENGYADQSHFIRSFKEFTGVSPFDYKKQVDEVAENFTVIKP